MKLSKRAAILLACSALLSVNFVGCKGDDDETNDTGGDGDGDTGDGDTGDGDTGDGDTGDGDAAVPPSPYQCDEPGEAQCTGSASGVVCPDGSTDGMPFTCAQGEECVDGACQGICDPGATECVGGSVQRVCTADGRSWVNIPCQAGDVCEDGACGLPGGLVCVPGSQDCDGNTARTCKDDGSGYDEMACPGATTCEDGACEGSVCTVGATRCDPETTWGRDQLFEGNELEFSSLLQTCVDGESWVTTACAVDDETREVCTYTNFDRVAAAKYKAEVAQWYDVLLVEANIDSSFENLAEHGMTYPALPEVPKGAKAACVALPDDTTCDDEFEAFFESPSDTRECADTDGIGDEEPFEYWKGYQDCVGLPPFAPLEVKVHECSGLTGCLGGEPELGCQAVDCLPGETMCSSDSDTEYGTCVYEPNGASFTFFESCPDDPGMGGVAPAMCTDGGTVPTRSVTCGSEVIEGDDYFYEMSPPGEEPDGPMAEPVLK